MKPFHKQLRNSILLTVLATTLLCGIKIITGIAKDGPQENNNTPDWKVKKVGPRRLGKKPEPNQAPSSESVIEDQIPSHVPIEVELLNLRKEGFLRNLVVKVTNTSNKPIYYLNLSLLLPDVLSPNGNPISFPIKYGRAELISFQEPIRPNDEAMLPRESYVFKIPEKNLGSFEQFATKKKLPLSEIKKVYLIFHLLNFGDGTGFSNTGGAPVPNTPQSQMMNSSGLGRVSHGRRVVKAA